MTNATTFDQLSNKEVFTDEFCKCPPGALTLKIMLYGTYVGVDKMEELIKNTYYRKESDKIISVINLLLSCQN